MKRNRTKELEYNRNSKKIKEDIENKENKKIYRCSYINCTHITYTPYSMAIHLKTHFDIDYNINN